LRRFGRAASFASVAALLAVLPGSPVATADVLPTPAVSAPVPTPSPVPAPTAGPLNIAQPPAGSMGSADAAPSNPAPSGSAALAQLGDPTTLLPGGDPNPPNQSQDSRQGPNDNRGESQQAQEFNRQQYVWTTQVNALNDSQDAIDAAYAGGGSGQFAWPENYRTISQPYGCTNARQAPTSSQCPSGHFHTGLDIAGPNLTDVYAADAGVARVFHGTTGYGNYVIITHGNGYSTLYGHLNDITVQDGQLVHRGDPIAHEGTTGNSTGPHLHFEIRFDGNYQNPCPFLEKCHD